MKAPRQPHHGLEHQHDGRRDRAAENAGEGVERERRADALLGDVVREQRVVGGVVHRVGETCDGVHRDQNQNDGTSPTSANATASSIRPQISSL